MMGILNTYRESGVDDPPDADVRLWYWAVGNMFPGFDMLSEFEGEGDNAEAANGDTNPANDTADDAGWQDDFPDENNPASAA